MNKQKLAGIFSNKLTVFVSLVLLAAGIFGISLLFSQPVSAAPEDDRPQACEAQQGGSFECWNYITPDGEFRGEDNKGTCTPNYSGSQNIYIDTDCDPAFARDATQEEIDSGETDPEAGGEVETGPQCGVDGGLGWIVCPASWLAARVIDGAIWFLDQLLFVEPLSLELDTDENPIYAMWSIIRNVANLMFVAAFLIIIFSQATSFGISNYGIKRMLPRLIIAAVMVNVSYFICAIGIEASNLVGSGIDNLVDGVLANTTVGNTDAGSPNTDLASFEGVILAGLFGGAAFAAIGTTVVASAILPILVMALFAVFVAVSVLVARQAIIILLVIISPLAFVAYLLPNTEGLFKKWSKGFMIMLIFYPLVIGIYAGAQLAAAVLRGSTSNPLIEVFSLGVQVAPLFALPFMLKFAGGVLNRVAGIVNHPEKGPFDSLKKAAEQRRDTARTQKEGRKITAGAQRRKGLEGKKFGKLGQRAAGALPAGRALSKIDSERKAAEAESIKSRAGLDYYADRVTKDQDYANKVAGAGPGREADAANLLRVQARGMEARDKLIGEEMQAAKTVIEDKTLPSSKLEALARYGVAGDVKSDGTLDLDESGQPKNVALAGGLYQKAAIGMLASQARIGSLEKIMKSTGDMDDDTKGYVAYQLQSNYAALKPKGHHLNDDVIKQALQEGRAVDPAVLQQSTKMMLSLVPQQFASQDNAALTHLQNAIANNRLDPQNAENNVKLVAKAKELAQKTLSDPQVEQFLTPITKVTMQNIVNQQPGQAGGNQGGNNPGGNPSTGNPTVAGDTLYVHGQGQTPPQPQSQPPQQQSAPSTPPAQPSPGSQPERNNPASPTQPSGGPSIAGEGGSPEQGEQGNPPPWEQPR